MAVQKSYPTLAGNPDLTWIVNDRHFQRLQAHIADARAKGARGGRDQPGRRAGAARASACCR